MDIKFNCKTCDQAIVIDESASGEIVDCPKCGAAVEVPATMRPSAGAIIPKLKNESKTSGYSVAVINMSSGTRFEITEIRLHSESALNKAASLKAQAAQKMGGWSSGVGFWGSLDWVLIGSSVVGAIESKVSQSMFKEGAQLLADAALQFDVARRSGKYIRIQELANLDSGSPETWRTLSSPRFIYNGDKFIGVKEKAGREILIALDLIEEMHLA